MNRLHPYVAVAVLALAPAASRGDGSDPRDMARSYVDTANDLFAKGQYGVACNTFREAHDLIPSDPVAISILYNMAVSCRRQYAVDGELSWLHRSLEYYTRYVSGVREGGRREESLRAVDDIQRILASRPAQPEATPLTQILVTSRTPGATARVDDGTPAEVPYPVSVSPGEHTIVVEAPGFRSASSKTVAIEGRLVVMPLDLEAVPARVAVTAPEEARIFLDGVHVGEAPLPGPATVDAGEHILTVTQPGYRSAVRRFEVGRGSALDVGIERMEYTDQRVASRWLLGGAGGAALAGVVTAAVALVKQEEAFAQNTDGTGGNHVSGACPADLPDCRSLAAYNSALAARNDLRTASVALFGSAGVLAIAGLMLHVLDTPEVPAPPVTVRAFGVSAPGEPTTPAGP